MHWSSLILITTVELFHSIVNQNLQIYQLLCVVQQSNHTVQVTLTHAMFPLAQAACSGVFPDVSAVSRNWENDELVNKYYMGEKYVTMFTDF